MTKPWHSQFTSVSTNESDERRDSIVLSILKNDWEGCVKKSWSKRPALNNMIPQYFYSGISTTVRLLFLLLYKIL